MAQMDDSVGKLIEALRLTNTLDNTLIVFLSDNGGTNRQLDNNYPFKGAKAEVYEGSYRTPLIVHWPEKLKPGRGDTTIHNIDLYPTLASALNLPLPEPLDGHSRWGHWLKLSTHNETLPQRTNEHGFRFWEKFNPNLGLMNFSVLSDDGNWRLSYNYDQSVSLYDLGNDPTGHQNVASSNPEQVAALKARYLQARRQQAQVAVTVGDSPERTISGFDQMRVSDEYSQTVLFELIVSKDDLEAELLLSQAGGWKITLDENRRVNLESAIGDLKGLHSISGNCAIIGLTTMYKRPAFIGGAKKISMIKLYLDGLLQDSIESSDVPPRRETWGNTLINSDRVGELRFFNQMAFGVGEAPPFKTEGHTRGGSEKMNQSEVFFYPKLEDLADGLCQGET